MSKMLFESLNQQKKLEVRNQLKSKLGPLVADIDKILEVDPVGKENMGRNT